MAPENKKRKPATPAPTRSSTLNIGTTATAAPPPPPIQEQLPQPMSAAPHAGASWFDMFAGAPTLGAPPQAPAIPQVGGTAAPTQPNVTDPLHAFLLGQRQQQQPMIQAPDVVGYIQALRSQGPVAEYNQLASLPSNAPGSLSPFATGYFNQPSQMGVSPEGVLATQGNTATNQLAQMGAVPNINPELLRRMNMGVQQRRLY